MIKYQHATVAGHNIFYREAGPKTAPAILLLHGFPTSSHMFRNLIPALADRYHVVAPDLPGFGFSDAPDRKQFRYTFEQLAKVIGSFTEIQRVQEIKDPEILLLLEIKLANKRLGARDFQSSTMVHKKKSHAGLFGGCAD